MFKMFHAVFSKGQFKRNPLKRHISVEIEVDRYKREIRSKEINLALNKWKDPVVRDGSLGDDGVEINTNPCNGDLFLDHIKELTDGLEKINAACSTACGLHVHVNVKGNPLLKPDGTPIINKDGELLYDPRTAYTHYDLRRLIMLYYRTEPAIFSLCAPQRISSRYSKPCGKFYLTKHNGSKDFRQEMVKKMYKVDSTPRRMSNWDGSEQPTPSHLEMRGNEYRIVTNQAHTGSRGGHFKAVGAKLKTEKARKYTDVRYNALNLHSFFMRGTVEFRHKEGTVNYNEIVNWSLICGTIVDMASKMTDKQIRELSLDPQVALSSILPDNLRQYAERKWAAQEQLQPRFKQLIADTWGTQPLEFE